MSFNLGLPQLILTALYLLGLIVSITKHGTPKGDHNAVAAFLELILTASLLYWGGFFG